MLSGTTVINLDDKGRLAIPAKYRGELQESCGLRMVVTVAVNEVGAGQKDCLWLYPFHEWKKLEESLSQLPSSSKNANYLKRFLIGNAHIYELDSQGRLLLPEKLRKLAGLGKKVSLVGLLNKFEIWNEEVLTAEEELWMGGEGFAEGAEIMGKLAL